MSPNEIDAPAHPQPPPTTGMPTPPPQAAAAVAASRPQHDGGLGAAAVPPSRARPHWLRPMTRTSRPTRNPAASSAALRRPQPQRAQTQRRSSAPPDSSSSFPGALLVASGERRYLSVQQEEHVASKCKGDDGDQDRHAGRVADWGGGGGSAGGGGGPKPIWLSEDEGARIREATAALKSRAGSSSSGGEGCSTTKRVRAAAASDDDVDDTEGRLSWRRKTGGLPPPVARSGPRYSHNVDANFAADGESHASNFTTTPPEECGSSSGSGVRNEHGSSGKVAETVEPPLESAGFSSFLGGPLRFPTFRRVASPCEAVAPPSGEDAEAASGLTPEQPPGVPQVGTEEQCTATLSECAEVNMDTAREVAARVDVGDFPVFDGRDPLYLSGDSSGSDIPLAVVVSRSCGPGKRALASPIGRKDKGKARADAFVSADVDASREEAPRDIDDMSSPRRAMATATPETPPRKSHSARGRSAKAKATPRMSEARALGATPRRVSGAMSSDTSHDEASDNGSPVRPVRARPRAKGIWRVVEPPRSRAHPARRFPAPPSARPRVWAGGKEELFAALPALAKNDGGVAWEGLECPTLLFSGARNDLGLGWWEDDAWECRRITFSIVREADVPLDSPIRRSGLTPHDSQIDAGGSMMPPEPPPNPPAPRFDHNGVLPTSPFPVPWASETTGLSPCFSKAGSSRFSQGDLTSATSHFIGRKEVPHSGMYHSSPFHKLGVRFDVMHTGGGLIPSISCGANNRYYESATEPSFGTVSHPGHQDTGNCTPVDRRAAETIRADGPTTPDFQSFLVHTHVDPSALSPLETRGTDHGLSCSAPPYAFEPPTDPPYRPVHPSSLELAPTNSICSPYQTSVDHSHAALGGLPLGYQDPHHLTPPPEVAALLTTQSSGDVVTAVFARNSPLVPWELPSEIKYFWLGLFKISEVKVETSPRRSISNTLTVQCAWRFSLEWVPGGEDLLMDEEQDDGREWSVRIMRPWWEPEHCQQEQHLSCGPSQNGASPTFLTYHDAVMTQPGLGYSRLLLPLPLLAPFTQNSTATGNFPFGYYCATCGRVNVQRFLRHRICESVTCNAKTDVQREIGWVIGAYSTRDRKVNSATVSPDDKWALPTTAESAISFDDGTRLFHYHFAAPTLAGDHGNSAAPNHPSDVGANGPSVRHIFNGNRAPLQAGASALFGTLQRDVRIERSIGATVFATPLIESADDPALGRNGRGVWDQQAGFIESALRAYCYDLGPLRVHAWRIHAWISDGKHRQTFCPRVKHLVIVCLGADISLLSVLPEPSAKSSSRARRESLRVTMVHGDIVVLSGGKFEFSMVRRGMCMLLEAECT